MITTTFRKLRSIPACKKRYKHLRNTIPKRNDTDPIDIIEILGANGLKDALWVPEKILSGPDLQMRYRLFAVACCLDFFHLMEDQGSKDAVRAAHLFCYGEITEYALAEARYAAAALAETLPEARHASWAAAWSAAGAAWRAARDAARAVARGEATNKQKEHFRRIFSEDFSD